MTKEEIYIKHKKDTLKLLVQRYNHVTGSNFKIDENFDIENTFCTPERCKDCGYCCKAFSCAFSPSDFLDINDIDYMREILKTGVVCISNTHKNKVYYLRIRGNFDIQDKNSDTCKIVCPEPNYGKYDCYNSCLLHKEDGCMLPIEYRPSQGILYYAVPNSSFKHITMYKDYQIEMDWEKYEDMIHQLSLEFYSFNVPRKIEEEQVKSFVKKMQGI